VIRVFIDRKIGGLHVMVWRVVVVWSCSLLEQEVSSNELFDDLGFKEKYTRLALKKAINAIKNMPNSLTLLCIVSHLFLSMDLNCDPNNSPISLHSRTGRVLGQPCVPAPRGAGVSAQSDCRYTRGTRHGPDDFGRCDI
jgi:hypothetical protein